MTDETLTMGTRLKLCREARNLTQAELAERAGVPLGTVRNWEQDRKVPTLNTAARVARALDVSLDVLAGIPAPTSSPPPFAPSAPPTEPSPQRPGRTGRGKG